MNLLTRLFIYSIFVLYYRNANSQISHEFSIFPFDTCLSQFENKQLINQLRDEAGINMIYIQDGKDKIPFSFNDKWRLLYYVHTGYEEVSERTDINDIYRNKHPENVLSIYEIFKEFEICDSVPDKWDSKEAFIENSFAINRHLQIPEAYRGFWFPLISKSGYLIFYNIHWYPNGGARSWLREYFYFFQKVE